MIETPEHDGPMPPASGPSDLAPFRCDTSFVDERATLTVRGELDLATAPVLEREAMAALALPLDGLVLDFGAVTFLDSSGIATLIAARRAAIDREVTFALVSVTRSCQLTLELAGLSDLFGIEG